MAALSPVAANPILFTASPHTTSETSNSVLKVAQRFFAEKAKDAIKLVRYSLQWAVWFNPASKATLGKPEAALGNAKNMLSALEIPGKIEKIWTAVTGAADSVALKVRKIVKEAAGLTNSVADGIELTSKFTPVAKETLRTVSMVNYGATLVGSGIGCAEQVEGLAKAQNKPTVGLYLINLARDVSFVVFACLGISSLGFGLCVAPWMFLATLTSGLLFGIGSFFYDNIVDPTGKNFDKDKMIGQLNVANQKRAELLAART